MLCVGAVRFSVENCWKIDAALTIYSIGPSPSRRALVLFRSTHTHVVEKTTTNVRHGDELTTVVIRCCGRLISILSGPIIVRHGR